MGIGIYGIGVSGLSAAQAGLVTTGHNIANANTPGFHRQQVVQSGALAQFTGAGAFGQGVEVDTVRRVYSDFLERETNRAQAHASYYAAYSGQLEKIDNLLSDPSAGLAPALQHFFEGVHDVASNPGSVSSRQAMLAAGSTLALRFQALQAQLEDSSRSVDAQIKTTVSSVNAYAREIASLNSRISMAQINPNQPPNDLIDERDQLISELNKLIGTSVVQQADGTVNVSIGSGQGLVVGNQAFGLAAIPDADVPNRLQVAFVVGSTMVPLQRNVLSGGSLGAVLAFRAGPLTEAQNELGRIAAGLAHTFNAQHRLGQDLLGNLGGDFFTPVQPVVTPRVSPVNTGTAAIGATVANATQLTASDYRLVYTGANYELTRLSDNVTTVYAALPQTVDGMTIALTAGAPAAGDSFLIEPTHYAARDFGLAITDAARIAAAAPIRGGSSANNTGTGVISAGVVNPPLNANLQQPVTITFTSATTFDVTGVGTGNPVGVAYTSGGNITYNGWTVRITGSPAAGDTFTVVPNTGGTSDNRNAALLADLQVTNTLNGGTASYQAAYAQLTSLLGNTAREMQIAADAQETIALRTRETQQAMSGINLDEEAANLLRYQQAYQASGKVIQIASTLFETILDIGR
ncbi:MAG TPA: flagellar hook-associated protein FlgK [Burkholderiales bacterium]|nr:flagellar hook-associated protein FlgK [Burkholderiales bacterium]